jgi:uncharacterized protein with von Willebrand factor type A (vWA) domain
VLFGTEVKVWQKKMQKANKEGKAAAHAWAKKEIEGNGNTNIFDALETAFEMIGRGSFDKGYGVTADTIIFMSDGVANRGRITETADILREIKRLNDLQKVQIHCVAVSAGADDKLLKAIADANGGQFVHIK